MRYRIRFRVVRYLDTEVSAQSELAALQQALNISEQVPPARCDTYWSAHYLDNEPTTQARIRIRHREPRDPGPEESVPKRYQTRASNTC